MASDPQFSQEFLSELNNFMTSDSWSQEVYDLVAPIRNLFLKPSDLISFSICRHNGALGSLAFL